MQPPEPFLLRCSHCGGRVIFWERGGGNTIRATAWTDGHIEGPMLLAARYPEYGPCPHCARLVWADNRWTEGQWLGHHELEVHRVPSLGEVTVAVCERALKAETLEPAQELTLRLHAWRLRSDPVREGGPRAADTPFDRENMQALTRLLSRQDAHERLLLAEVHRQLGEDERCLELLDFDFDPDALPLVNAMLDGIEEENPAVRVVWTDAR